MTVISTLPPSDPKTKVNRDILLALFTPLGKCRILEEKVRLVGRRFAVQTKFRLTDRCMCGHSTLMPSRQCVDQVRRSSASCSRRWPTEE